MSKVALITGAAQGLGRAISYQLAKDGFHIAVADLSSNQANAEATLSEIEKLGQKAVFIPTDVRVASEVTNAVNEAFTKLNGFNVMINNAGIAARSPIIQQPPEEFDNVIKTNINGVFHGIQAAALKFIELKQPGKIINAASVASFFAGPNVVAYNASKHAVRGLTHSSARELAQYGITVNSYNPFMTETEMLKLLPQELREHYLKLVPAGRFGTTEDVTNIVSFLASDKATDYMTGHSYIVDGGLFPN